MSILADTEIWQRVIQYGMISPFVEKQQGQGVISYGLSSYGYDARIANKFRIFYNKSGKVIDPKEKLVHPNMDYCLHEIEADHCIIPPNSYVLGHTVETFKLPRDILALCVGKSTYARWGIIVNVTPLEPGWRGVVTLEISNATPCPVKIYANEGICQFLFFKGETPCGTCYADRAGKYQDQSGITLGIVK